MVACMDATWKTKLLLLVTLTFYVALKVGTCKIQIHRKSRQSNSYINQRKVEERRPNDRDRKFDIVKFVVSSGESFVIMASFRVFFLFVSVLACCVLLLPSPVFCNVVEDNLLQGINSYRKNQNLPVLSKNEKANCIADKVANDLQHQPCTVAANGANIVGSNPTQLPNFSSYLKDCNVKNGTASDGVIMPICVPDLVPTLVLTNYTQTKYAKYLNDTTYTGAGVGSEDDWMVVILTTNSPGGSFAGSDSRVLKPGFGLIALLFALFALI